MGITLNCFQGTNTWLANRTQYWYTATAGGTDLGIGFWLTGRVSNSVGQGAHKCIACPSVTPAFGVAWRAVVLGAYGSPGKPLSSWVKPPGSA